MRKVLLSALVVALLLGTRTGGPVQAQDESRQALKPVLVVSFSGYDEVLKDIEFIGKLAGNPKLAMLAEVGIKQAAGDQGLAGLDKAKPWGVVVETDGQQFSIYGFVPVTDLDQLLKVLEPVVGQPTEGSDGLLEIEIQDQTVYLKEKNGWALIGNTPDAVTNAPADPIKPLDGLYESYDLAVRVMVRNIPELYRQYFTGALQIGLQAGMQKMPGESDEQYQLRTEMVQQAMKQMTTVINDLDTFQIGFAVDQESASAYLDYVLTAIEGTKTAEQMAGVGELKTNFAGFLGPNAAVAMNVTTEIAESEVAQATNAIAALRANAMKELEGQGLSDEELELAKKLLGDLMDVIVQTIEAKRVDAAMSLLLKPDALTFIAGMHVADSEKLEGLAKQMTEQIIKDEPDAADAITLDAEQYQGVRFHTLVIPTDELRDVEGLPQLVGDTLDVVLGFGGQGVYLAIGRDASKTLKQAIDKSKAQADKVVPPMNLAVAATPIAKFAAAVGEDEVKGVATMIAAMLEQAGEKDHLTITATPITNGQKVRIEIEEGLLKVLGSLPMILGGLQAAGTTGF